MHLISWVIPVYHEEESLPLFFEKVNPIMDSLKDKYEFELLFVTDMPDVGTYNLLEQYQEKQNNIVILRLSRSFGHEEAVAAGLKHAKGDAVIPLDGDLQDDPDVIPTMLTKWEEGYQVVNGKRSSRSEKGLSKLFVKTFYRLFHKWSKKINIPENVGDFRLLDRRVVDEINDNYEKYRVLKIEVPYVGFKTCEVTYVRQDRQKGKTHYKKSALFKNAFDYYCVISDKLLGVVFKISLASIILSFVGGLTLLILYLIEHYGPYIGLDIIGITVWAIINAFIFLSGIIEFCLYIVGGYAYRAYVEANPRKPYIVESIKYSKDK